MILKAFHNLSSDTKTRDQVEDNVSALSYQAVSQQMITNAPAFENTSSAELGGKLLLQGEIKPGGQTFPLIFTIICQVNHLVLFNYLFVQQIFTKHLGCIWFYIGTGTSRTCELFYLTLSFLSSFIPSSLPMEMVVTDLPQQ